MSFVELENTTGVVQQAYAEDGTKYVLAPRTTRAFRDDVAFLFLNQRKAQVRRADETNVPPVLIGERPVWLANMQGSPFEPKEWEVEVLEKGVPVIKKYPNPKAVSRTLKYPIDIGQGNDPYGQISTMVTESVGKDFNLPPREVIIRPRQRVCVGHKIAQVILQRDALCGDLGNRQVIECRAPSVFEPGMSWDLPKILFYARMVSEDDFRIEWLNEELASTDPDRSTRRGQVDLKEVFRNTLWLDQVKDDTLGRLFYRIVDENYALPTDTAFNRYFEESLKALKDKQPMPRGPGRPKKIVQEVVRKDLAELEAPVPIADPGAMMDMMKVVEAGLKPQQDAENAPIEQIAPPTPTEGTPPA